jgi:GTP cyclohydrolase IA
VTGVADRRLRVARPLGRVDPEAAEDAVRSLLDALGADPAAEGLAGTPRRVAAAAYAELLTPVPFTPTTFPNDEGYDELVVARAIPFHSLCQHHLLPFHGAAHVGYLPGERIVGLSSWPGWWTCSPATSRPRNGSPGRSPAGSRSGWSRAGPGWWSTPSTCA